MRITVITEPTFEPVTLAEAKLWCRIDEDHTDSDAVVMLLIRSMRELAEFLTGRAFVSRTLELGMDAFPVDPVIELPFPPVTSVTSITYIDGNGDAQTLAGSPEEFQSDLSVDQPARIAPLSGGSWPATAGDTLNAVRVRFVAGYSNPNSIPKLVRLWMQAKISTHHEFREMLLAGSQVQNVPRDWTDGLLDGLRAKKGFA